MEVIYSNLDRRGPEKSGGEVEPRMVCWRPGSLTSFLWRRGGSISTAFVTGWRCPALSTPSASTMAVWQRDLPQEWEVRPAPDKSGGRWRKKRRISQQGGALGEGGEGTSAQEDPPNSLKGEEDTNIVLGRRSPWWGGGRRSQWHFF